MNLVDDEDLVLSNLRRDAHLVAQAAYVLDAVVRCRIKFYDVVRTLLVECHATLALVARLAVLVWRQAVDGLCKDSGAGCLSHASRSAEEVGVCQLLLLYGILQRYGQRLLSNNRIERLRTVFSCRDNEILHSPKKFFFLDFSAKVAKIND